MRKILIVDDDKLMRDVMSGMLEDYDVFKASNDVEALDAFRDHNPQVVLMDLRLGPNSLTGVEICQQMIKLRPGVRVVCISGAMLKFAPEYGTDGGFSAIILQPLTVDELRRVVAEQFDANP